MTMMNVAEILSNTLSPVAQIREEATRSLERLATESFPSYLMLLCQEMANEQSAPHIRKAAGIGLKNTLSAKESHRLEEYAMRWLSTDAGTRVQIKTGAIQTLGSPDTSVGTVAAQVIAAISVIELPKGQWPELIPSLLTQMTTSKTPTMKQMALQAIGFICESNADEEMLCTQSNAILNAVAQGAGKEETNPAVRLAAIQALNNSLEFVRENFERDGERNYIMQIVCEATQATDSDLQVAAFECLCRIMSLYYDHMNIYMNQALYGITILGMRHQNDRVALQAVEFWSTVCEIELEMALEAEEAIDLGEPFDKVSHNFAQQACKDLLDPLLWLLTQKEDEEDEDEWSIAMASATCLASLANVVKDAIVTPVVSFIQTRIRSENWRDRDGAVMAFGSILDGPNPTSLLSVIHEALPVLVGHMKDPSPHVKDSTAWTLGRISEILGASLAPEQLDALVAAVIPGLADTPRVAGNCAWCFISLAECLGTGDDDELTNTLSRYYETIVMALIQTGENPAMDPNTRASCYEAIATVTCYSAKDVHPALQNLAIHVLDRLEKTIATQAQLLGGDDRRAHHEIQANLCNVLTSVLRKLNKEISPAADRIMQDVLTVMSGASAGSTVMEDAFLVVGALTSCTEADFIRYMDPFAPFLFKALSNHEEHQTCSIAIGVMGDVCRALNEGVAAYCDNVMSILLQHLQNPMVHQLVKPACLSCFGDIALAIGGKFELYLPTVVGTLIQVYQGIAGEAATYEMEDLYNSLKEGIIEAFIGIIQGLKSSEKVNLIGPYVQPMFTMAEQIAGIPNRPESLTRCLAGMVGDLAETFPPGFLKPLFCSPWVEAFLKEIKTDRGVSINTKEVGKWAREMVRKQVNA